MVINHAAIMGETVGDKQVAGTQHHVVAHNLVKNRLRYIDRRGFVFDDDERRCRPIVDDGVAASPGVVERDAGFVDNERAGVAFVRNEIIDKMLPDPFFGSQGDILVTQAVIYHDAVVGLLQTDVA